ncbi:MAG: NfeD family protein [Thermincolia bacterium]
MTGFKWFFVSMIILGIILPGAALASSGSIYVIPVRGAIEEGLAAFVERNLNKAEEEGAKAVILEIDTPGGTINGATMMKKAILDAKIPVIAFVDGGAFSAGALITLAANKIAMTPGSAVGAAEPRPAEEKIISGWRSEMESTAEARGRDENIAAAMVDKDVYLPNLKEKGKILSLSANKAVEVGLADMLVQDRTELLKELGYARQPIVEVKPGAAETLARWVTHPMVSPFLLTIGIAGLLLAALTISWGVAGTLGLLALSLYFGGHMLAGFTGWEAVLVFLIGLIALVLEIFLIPGFGIAGVLGVLMVGTSIFLASRSITDAVISLVIAIVGSIVILAMGLKFMKKRNFWDKIILGTRMVNQEGYVAPKLELTQFLGQEGVTITPLRPAGTADFQGRRLDVVTEGGFIKDGVTVKVLLVEGTRVVVREV